MFNASGVRSFVRAIPPAAVLVLLAATQAWAQAEVVHSCFPTAVEVFGTPAPGRIEVTCAGWVESANNAFHNPNDGAYTVRRFALPFNDASAGRFNRLATVAVAQGLVLSLDYRLDGSNRFTGCDDQSCRRPIFFGVSRDGLDACPAYNPFVPDTAFCTADCGCNIGQGDCDSADDCVGDTVCRQGSWGAAYGLPASYDTCQPKQCAAGSCNPGLGCLCFAGEGPCAVDNDCAGHLICNPTSHLCESCPAWSSATRVCSARCPCGPHEGNCVPDAADPEVAATPSGAPKRSAQCRRLTTCSVDVGASFGMPAETNVCVPFYESAIVP